MEKPPFEKISGGGADAALKLKVREMMLEPTMAITDLTPDIIRIMLEQEIDLIRKDAIRENRRRGQQTNSIEPIDEEFLDFAKRASIQRILQAVAETTENKFFSEEHAREYLHSLFDPVISALLHGHSAGGDTGEPL